MSAISSLSKRRKANAADRTKILEVSAKLFRKHGFEAVGMRDIALAAGTNPVQVYRLGLTKAEILGELVVKLNARQARKMKAIDMARLGKTARSRIEGYLLALYRLDIQDKQLRKLGAAYGWLWPREREAEVIGQITQLVGPVEAELRRAGLDQVENRCRAIWSLYYVGYRAAVIHDATAEECLAGISGAIGLIVPDAAPDLKRRETA